MKLTPAKKANKKSRKFVVKNGPNNAAKIKTDMDAFQ